MLLRRSFLGFIPVAVAASPQWEDLLGRIFGRGDDRIALGLKEALSVGAGNAVLRLGRKDGYFADLAVKILLPERLRKAESSLRLVGMGPALDELVLGMNRAAERAAPFAKAIFLDAVKRMTFSDVKKILNGGDTAATTYFKETTYDPLTAAFRPPVVEAMGEVGVVKTYNDLFARLQKVPFVRVERFDLESYVVARALDGLFFVVGEEEKKIRRDPAARVTAILREVFGRR